MDNSWLFDNEVDSHEPESNDEETQTELESRLYAIVHHNDLSQPLPPSLAKHYSIVRAEDGELEVILKHSLEDIKLEEIHSPHSPPKNESTFDDNDSRELNPIENDNDDAIVVIPQNSTGGVTEVVDDPVKRHKRFRYSDVNVDNCVAKNHTDSGPEGINFFSHGPGLFRSKKNKEFSKLNIPPFFNSSNWKDDANSSFIAFDNFKSQANILDKMTEALVKYNPGVKFVKLAKLAVVLYKRNLKTSKKKKNKKFKNSNVSLDPNSLLNNTNSTVDLTQELKALRNNVGSEIQGCKERIKNKKKKQFTGSISLNISPFRPAPPVIDLTSDDEFKTEENDIFTSTPKLKLIRNKLQLPVKWNKEMAKYYSKPSQRKKKMDLNVIIANLKKTTKSKDWKIDSRDQVGIYQQPVSVMKKKKCRCTNCNERGHGARDCPYPFKPPACFLCGQFYHTHITCPNKICMKCGIFMPEDYYGGECHNCYYINFDYDSPCEICGTLHHKSKNCTDLWRSYHATTEGEKKIPAKFIVNPKKCCCNCAQKGHFSEECPLPMYSGQQMSSFVSNYSCSTAELGTAEIVFPHIYSDILTSPNADMFLQGLSDSTNAGIVYNEKQEGLIFEIKGTFDQCKKVKAEIETYINVKKRKWQEPMLTRKRQRIS